MGLGLAIEPNLEDFSCKFQFGKTALDAMEDPMYREPCLAKCAMASKSTICQTACHSIPPITEIQLEQISVLGEEMRSN